MRANRLIVGWARCPAAFRGWSDLLRSLFDKRSIGKVVSFCERPVESQGVQDSSLKRRGLTNQWIMAILYDTIVNASPIESSHRRTCLPEGYVRSFQEDHGKKYKEALFWHIQLGRSNILEDPT